ncbi:DoxX family protein [Pseudomonas oryzihabitans]|nr:DoxX family protein [Pseudomonas psychrotolerans]
MSTERQVHWLARGALVLMFAYHGLVPKLLQLSPGEQFMIQAHGFQQTVEIARLAGLAELAFALVLLLTPRLGWPLILAAAVLLGLLVDVALVAPKLLMDAFNPVTLNLACISLCAIAWLTRPHEE